MTLLELLIVIGIIVVMVSMVFIATRGGWVDAGKKLTESTMLILDGALEDFRENNTDGVLFPRQDFLSGVVFSEDRVLHSASLYVQLYQVPESRKALERLDNTQVNFEKEFNKYPVFYDAWGTVMDYRYAAAGDSYPLIVSAGPDKTFGSNDDITNRK